MTVEIETRFIPLSATTEKDAHRELDLLMREYSVNPSISVGPGMIETRSLPEDKRPLAAGKWCAVLKEARLG